MKIQWAVFLMTFLLGTTCPAAGEPFTKLTFARAGNDTWKAKINGKEILFVNEEEPGQYPEIWTGDLQIRDLKTGRLCTVNASMIGEVYARKDGKVIISITEVGAGETFSFIDIDTCKDKYPFIGGYSKRPHIKSNTIVSGPVCEELRSGISACSSADVYALDADARPIWLEKESMERTVQVLGVEFKGSRLVENPRTKHAKLLPEEPEEKKEGWFSSIKKWFSF